MIKLKHLITETHLRNLFHVTHFSELNSILNDNAIKLTFVHGSKADFLLNKGYHFFLSTMRQKYGNYASGIGDNYSKEVYRPVVINLNGHALVANGFKAFPIDYWCAGPNYSEQEERIVSNSDEITPLKKYVDSIHVYIGELEELNRIFITKLIKIDDMAHQLKIPIYFYQKKDREYFKQQRTERALTTVTNILDKHELTSDELESMNYYKKHKIYDKRLHILIDFYNGVELDMSNKDNQDFIRLLTWYPKELIMRVKNIIHNEKRHHLEIFRELSAIMIKNGFKTIDDMVMSIYDKYLEKQEKERLANSI